MIKLPPSAFTFNNLKRPLKISSKNVLEQLLKPLLLTECDCSSKMKKKKKLINCKFNQKLIYNLKYACKLTRGLALCVSTHSTCKGISSIR